MKSPLPLIRPLVRGMQPYVPGEQPKIRGLIKLNTNENPYAPSPKVLRAIRAAADSRLRLYPNPTSQALREQIARVHGCAPAQVMVTNGSDEALALAVRAFVEPAPVRAGRLEGSGPRHGRRDADARTVVQYLTPSYSLYPVLAEAHGAVRRAVPLAPDFDLPDVPALRRAGWRFDAALTFITTPNAPSGRGYSTRALDGLCRAQRGVVVLDEAYVDFAREHAMPLASAHPHVLVARTFSKAYSLCFLRVGYLVGHPALIAALDKIRDSYNVNGLGQIAALAALGDLPYYRANFRRIVRTRERLASSLAALGFEVRPSETNFLLVRPPLLAAKEWLTRLRERRILVRWFGAPDVREYLRITVGSDRETTALLKAVTGILKGLSQKGAE